MKPYVICHMMSSVDGRIDAARWPGDIGKDYEPIHDILAGDAWIVGRTTMEEFAKGEPGSGLPTTPLPRTTHVATTATGYAIALDPKGKLHWSSNTANGNHVIEVLSEAVSDAYLLELQDAGISYLFAGADEIDLGEALESLNREFGIKRLLLEGGGHINGSFLAAGLIDELSLLVAPLADGVGGVPTVFERGGEPESIPVAQMHLRAVEQRANGAVWLRYDFSKKPD
jgi:riboflavin biosynthesis pyrimidine reductase